MEENERKLRVEHVFKPSPPRHQKQSICSRQASSSQDLVFVAVQIMILQILQSVSMPKDILGPS